MPAALMASKHGRHVSYMGGFSSRHHSMSLPHLQIHSEGIEPWLRIDHSAKPLRRKGRHRPIGVFHHGCLGGGIMVENAWPCGIPWLGDMVPVIL